MAPGLIAVGVPEGGTVPVAASMIHITAISLGHPSLAIVNGVQVAEGGYVTVQVSRPLVRVKLRVVRITDGQIDLTDGTQVLTAHLEVQPLKKPTRP